MSKFMEASDGASDGSVNYPSFGLSGLLAACHAIIILVQPGAANRKALRIFSRGIQQNLVDECSFEEAAVSGIWWTSRTHRNYFFTCANSKLIMIGAARLDRKAQFQSLRS